MIRAAPCTRAIHRGLKYSLISCLGFMVYAHGKSLNPNGSGQGAHAVTNTSPNSVFLARTLFLARTRCQKKLEMLVGHTSMRREASTPCAKVSMVLARCGCQGY